MVVLAQSSNATLQPEVSLPAHLLEGPVPGAFITGYVLDEDGNPVPGAVVSLWQDGQLWQSGKYEYYPSNNPQKTNIAYSNTGFRFGYIYPGEYTLTAEKDGYKRGPVGVHVGNETLSPTLLDSVAKPIMVNFTLNGYHVPTLTPEQRSYTGAIAGNIWAAAGYPVTAVIGVNVSLWRDGRLVDRPDNPQSSFKQNFSGESVDYLFEHLAPGRYTVMAEYQTPYVYNDTVSVDVGTRPMRADIVLSHMLTRPSGYPVVSFTPTVGEFSASPRADSSATALPSMGLRPTPALAGLFVLLLIGAVAYFMHKKNEKR